MKQVSLLIVCLTLLITACQTIEVPEEPKVEEKHEHDQIEVDAGRENTFNEEISKEEGENEIKLEQYEGKDPDQWGENVTGVKTSIKTDERVIALTFDACGGPYGNGYDEELIQFLKSEQIPATLFINERWIKEHEKAFLELAKDPLFQIENHGTAHVPLSVTGKAAWGIEGTNSPEEIVNEVMANQETIESLTGRAPTMFRSGTAFYDEVAVEIVNELGLEVVNFDILGDAGATYNADQVYTALLQAKKGSIALLHMNQPQSGTAEGVKRAVLQLELDGFSFVNLDGFELQ
ncbi:polysaccharide deacetylase family protein [Halalkalibacter krulwichiae]|uniref:Peptidoglycan-N-acetylmuramic acid deacetylase PdaA n=1 Tax=Halalkalibacter krulwichiae TaxID=199441 RepID=A0A1X9M6B6_9BACI|nr:polysaccharide deacetylase family protein [Halalkalibacter krulwichiae]ARK28977.1 Peptidoglycan-N-acetylmuramic acid deacetylase PdaA precursor [Halalkalibacter krulwichiae]